MAQPGKQFRRERRQVPVKWCLRERSTQNWGGDRATSQRDASSLIADYVLLSKTAADTKLIEGGFDPLSNIETWVVGQ
jgi:hypothetical protein